jgi:hypothetical protein
MVPVMTAGGRSDAGGEAGTGSGEVTGSVAGDAMSWSAGSGIGHLIPWS